MIEDDGEDDWAEEWEELSAFEAVALVALGATVGLVVLAVGIAWGALDLAGRLAELRHRRE